MSIPFLASDLFVLFEQCIKNSVLIGAFEQIEEDPLDGTCLCYNYFIIFDTELIQIGLLDSGFVGIKALPSKFLWQMLLPFFQILLSKRSKN